MKIPYRRIATILLGFLTLVCGQALAQNPSVAIPIALQANVPEQISISLNTATADFGNLADGAALSQFQPTVQITTTWKLSPTRTALNIYAYFATAFSLQDDATGTVQLPTTWIESDINNVTAGTGFSGAFTPFTAGGGNWGDGVQIDSIAVLPVSKNGSNIHDLQLNLNLTARTVSDAGTYSGTLNIRAEAL